MEDGLLGLDLSDDDEDEVMQTIALQKSLISESQLLMREIECDVPRISDAPHDNSFVDTTINDTQQEETSLSDALAANYDYDGYLARLETNLKKLIAGCKANLEDLARSQAAGQGKSKKRINVLGGCSRVYNFGAPFFKDKDLYPCPPNPDTISKMQHEEYCWIDIPTIQWWKPKDTKQLIEATTDQCHQACRQDALSEKSALVRRCKVLEENSQERSKLEKDIQNFNIDSYVSSHFSEKIATMDFDWMQLSVTVLNGKHSADDCRGFWYNFLSPKFNKEAWGQEETLKLMSLVEENKAQNWDLIAEKLGTDRSGYQCFCLYNSAVKKGIPGKWTKAEDKQLMAAVEKVRVGDFIPWGQVSIHLPNRSKHQVYNRWTSCLDPRIKKGRFTLQEDIIILRGVQKWGQDFAKIASYMSDRTSQQIRCRYTDNISKGEFKPWTTEEDKLLIDLAQNNQGPTSWIQIAKNFPGKTAHRVRHRYDTLKKHMETDSGRPVPKVLSRRNNPIKNDIYNSHPKMWAYADKLFSSGNPKNLSVSLQNRTPTAITAQSPKSKKRKVNEVDKLLAEYFEHTYFQSPAGHNQFPTWPERDPMLISNMAAFLELLGAKLSIPSDQCLDDDKSLEPDDREVLKSLRSAHANVLEQGKPGPDILNVSINHELDGYDCLNPNIDCVQPSNKSCTLAALDSFSGSFGNPWTTPDTLEPEPEAPEPPAKPAHPVFGTLEYLCPPNISTMIGLRSLLLSKRNLVNAVSDYATNPILTQHDSNNEAFRKAVQLWDDRLMCLFSLPNVLCKMKLPDSDERVPATGGSSPPNTGPLNDGPREVFDIGRSVVTDDGAVHVMLTGQQSTLGKRNNVGKPNNPPKKRVKK